RGTRTIRNSPRAAGGSPTLRSSASASYSLRNEPVMTPTHPRDVTRREFVETTAAATAAIALPHAPSIRKGAPKPIRIALIGCGGRGTGAVKDCLTSSENIELVALGDLFPDHLAKCRESLATMATEDPTLKPKIKVKDSQCFVGFDAYRKVLEDNADLVLLATPPAFRARHLAAAIDAGKHVFMEKPVAVDPQGVRAVMASAELAAQKGLAIVAGTQRRHDAGYRAAMERIHDAAIGDLVAAEVSWHLGRPLGHRGCRDLELGPAGAQDQPLRAGACRPDREHSRGPAAQRGPPGGREHADGDHGPRGRLHRPGSHLGRAVELPVGPGSDRGAIRADAGAAGRDARVDDPGPQLAERLSHGAARLCGGGRRLRGRHRAVPLPGLEPRACARGQAISSPADSGRSADGRHPGRGRVLRGRGHG